jgi:hypothetical protein
MPPCPSAAADSEPDAPNSQPWLMKLCIALTVSKIKTSRVFATPKPRPACTPTIFMKVWRWVRLLTTMPLPCCPPANSSLMPKVLNTA